MSQNILIKRDAISVEAVKAFRACGLVPFYPKKVLAKVDRTLPGVSASRQHVRDLFLRQVQTLCEAALSPRERGVRSKRVRVEPGVSDAAADLVPSTTNRRGTGRKVVTKGRQHYTDSDKVTSDEDDPD